ncbi:MAG TPA: bifunctional 2-C-methyl-D-erythritol 4-phosphate cytidylyltransferase/2-C-methyl-D-erythritol 2,4-cyclodiphosphate synthase [Allosphingosinicella sp.]|nr:bifunctional 2-C-methyl-D-erythritol 4-phosphate cytidylyltransferase/2-C-methyl-D-erythritol 2,4-cyclodiphosphate synthase [Allosphingosinicella sp.]
MPKQYAELGGKPVLAHAVDRLLPLVDQVQVAIGAGQEALYAAAVGDRRLPPPILGGETRRQSVRNGLEAIAASGGAGIVLIHDAARPLIAAEVVHRLVRALDQSEGAVPGLPVVDTLAVGTTQLGDAVSRENLLRVQTPQAFRFDAILEAHRRWEGAFEPTDDAQLARAAGLTIATVAGDKSLEKLTYESDFEELERHLATTLVSRTGLGFDVHAFAEGEELWLGGIQIPHRRGLKGHSDADVVLHALTDALLGAAGEGDIGDHFPPSDPQWRGAPSSHFLLHARRLIDARGGRIDHVDVTIICEEPRIGPHRQQMRDNIAALLGLPVRSVSVKATTTERLGFTGRGEGIAAQAVASVRLPEER